MEIYTIQAMHKRNSTVTSNAGLALTIFTGTGFSGGMLAGGLALKVPTGSLKMRQALTATAKPIRIRAMRAVRLIRGLERLERAK
jgi:hypothetical protein